MALSIKALHPVFAAEVSGVDLRVAVDQETIGEIAAALDLYAVLVFPKQPLSNYQQLRFSRRFGTLENALGSIRPGRQLRLGDTRLADISNLDAHNEVRSPSDPWRLMQLANQLWHTDSSFKPISGKISFLTAHELPSVGGETEFADLRAAYEALDVDVQLQIENMVAEHSVFYSRSLFGYREFTEHERVAFPPVPQAVVRVHPDSGRTTLYLASHASHIVGLPIAQGRALLDDLITFSTQPRFVHRHKWRLHDLVMWDNRCTMHRATPYEDTRERRDMRRTTVEDTYPTPSRVRTQRSSSAKRT